MGERKRWPENCKKQVLFPGRWHKETGPVCCPSRHMEESSLMQAGLGPRCHFSHSLLNLVRARQSSNWLCVPNVVQGPWKNSQAEPRVVRVTEFQSHFLTVPCHGFLFQFPEPRFCWSMKWSLSFMVNECKLQFQIPDHVLVLGSLSLVSFSTLL